MQLGQKLPFRLLATVAVICSLAIVGLFTPIATAQSSLTVVASNLDNPRGLAFGPGGALYVTEAGRGGSGPCVGGAEGQQCYGASGAITRVISGTQERIVTGLPSLAAAGGNRATGPHDISLLQNGDAYVVVGLGNNPDVRSTLGVSGTGFGQLMRVDLGGRQQNVADLAAYEKASDPDGAGADSNPYAVVALHDRRLVVDAGGNDLLEVAPNGSILTLTTVPTRTVTGPGGAPIPMQSVPNSLAIGPDGAYYLGELTGIPFPVGGARVYRVVPGQAPEIYAEGFTNIIDMAFASDGSLYVLEIAANGLRSGNPTGALIRVAPDKTKTTIASDGLNNPAGIAISPAGGIYVSNFGTSAGQGQVVRLNQCPADVTGCTEPTPLATPLSTTLTGAAEVDNTGAPNKGDPDARGTATVTLNATTNQVCIQAQVTNVAPLAMAHIHKAPAGVNGDVIIPFTNLITGTAKTIVSGCVSATAEQIAGVQANPAGYYVNVHNADFPAGAARGQLAAGDAVNPTFTPVASNLDNPRGLAFGPNGALYVAEAGRGGSGPCFGGTQGQQCYGASGAITRVLSGTQERLVTGLPSLAGTDGSAATGPHDISLQADGTAYVVTGLGGNTTVRNSLGISGTDLGQLMRIDANGTRRNVADLTTYEQVVDPFKAEDGPDSNPYAVVALKDKRLVVDAGGNDLLEVDARGSISTLAVFPDRLVSAPPIPNLPPQISMQSVPNTVAIGPDGAYYVGELTGFPFPVGGARVYRVVPGKAPEIYAEGFTNIIDMAFRSDGSLYVLEIAAKGLLQAQQPGGDFTGALVRVAPDKTKVTVASQGLVAPGGIAISSAGGIYVSNFSIFAGQGQVVRVNLCDPQDTTCSEPAAPTQPLVATLSGAEEVSNTSNLALQQTTALNAGDLDARGSVIVTLDPEAGTACVQGSVSNVAPLTMAHIHRGAAGTNGPVVLPFTTLISNTATGSTLSGCVSGDKALLTDIQTNPSNYYFNVHNADFPAGAARGQLALANAGEQRVSLVFLPLIVK